MSLTDRDTWTTVHGLFFGALFLLAFAGGLTGFYSLRPEWLTTAGIMERIQRLDIGVTVMAVMGWLTVITGSFVIYPWYRAAAPQGMTGQALEAYPKALLLSNPATADWHNFGMEWKEHIAWFAPILATAGAYVVLRYGPRIALHPRVRVGLLTLFVIAFAAAGIGGIFGAFTNKAAPLR